MEGLMSVTGYTTVGTRLTQALLHLKVLLQLKMVGDLFLFLDQIQAIWHDWVIFKLVFTHLHQYFDHVLHTLADRAPVQEGAKALEYDGIGFWRIFGEKGPNFSHETDCDLNRVISWAVEQ